MPYRSALTTVVALAAALAAAPAALAAFPGANGRIAFQTANGLGTIDSAGGDRRPLIEGSAVFATPAWSPDGQRVAYASNVDGDFEVYVVGAGGGAVAQLTHNAAEDGAPAWSPDGSRIAFESDRAGPSRIFVMNADGSGAGPLASTPSELGDRAPAWSPDGTRIVFSRGPDGAADIWTVRAAGGDGVPMTSDPADETNPDWSPDGARIAFQRAGAIVVMGANGTGPVPLLVAGNRPAWAPDGSRIAFDSNGELHSVAPDGSGFARLTVAGSSALIAQAPTWQPLPLAGGPAPPPPADPAPPGAGRVPSAPLLKRSVKASLTTDRLRGHSTFTALTVKPVRRGDVLRLSCKGRGCPLSAVTIRVKERRRSLSLLRHLRGARLRKGAVVRLRVTRPGATGRVTTWRIRAPKEPRVTRLCLAPGRSKPVACPR